MRCAGALLSMVVVFGCARPELPTFEAVKAAYRPSEAYLLDRHGDLLQVSRLDFHRRRIAWTPLESVSTPLITAIVKAEDRRFQDHHGVDWRALGSAAVGRLSGTRRGGASTLTMQVAAMLDPSLSPTAGGRTWWQKVRQVDAALSLERHWTKPQILETYLNLVGFRGELVGIGATSHGLFGKVPSGVDVVEAALLAALLPAPNASAEGLVRRACTIARGIDSSIPDCTPLELAAATLMQRLAFPNREPAFAPHAARELLRRSGDRVSTTLDLAVQRTSIEALTAQLSRLAAHHVRDGAAIALDNSSGDVLAWVGSAGPHSTAAQVDGVRARRQAGSTLKPFLYGLAIERRHLTAASILDDSPIALETGAGLYIPQNYDHEFKGLVSVRTALAASLNVPAVRTLVLIGVEPYRDRLRAFGYRSLTEDGEYYGYSLALGSADVSLAEQANAYRTLANGGLFTPLRQTRDEPELVPTRVLSDAAAFVVGDILSDRGGRAPTFGLDNALATRYWSAVKTGTSKDMRDNWCIGFSRRYTVAVWVGNFEGDAMHDVSGVTGAAPAWLSIMNSLHEAGDDTARLPVAGVQSRRVRFEPAIEPPRIEWFLAGTELTEVRAVDPRGQPRIVSPPNGAVIALDPDIPPAHQVVSFVARGASKHIDFELDGAPLGPATDIHRLTPSPGAHVLRLVSATTTHTLDEVRFVVRAPRSGL